MNSLKSIYKPLAVFICCLIAFSGYGQTYFANGTTKSVGQDCFQLTRNQNWQNGSVWYADKIDLTKDFDLEFFMNFGSNDNGADGIVFVLQNKGNKALGQAGGGLGYEGFSPSLGIEFDDFYNASVNDPNYDHIGVFKNGIIDHRSQHSLFAPVEAIPNKGNIEDGKDHLVRVKWTANSKHLQVYFDCIKRVDMNIDISKEIFSNENKVYWGFTAATGGLNNNQSVCLRRDILTQDSISICKGNTAKLNSRKSIDDVYNWFPKIDLNNPQIKQPICSTTISRRYMVEFTDLCKEKVVDTIEVIIDQPFVIDEVRDTLLCDGKLLQIDLKNEYDSAIWDDGNQKQNRWLSDSGYYKFRVWKGSCWDDDSFNLKRSETPYIKILGDSTFCAGDSSLISLEFKPKNADIIWHDNTSDTMYWAKQSENILVDIASPCGSSKAIYPVREISIPQIQMSGDTVYCEGDSVKLTISNNENYEVKWNDGFTGTTRKVINGKYVAQIDDKGCTSNDSIEIEHRDLPLAKEFNFDILCEFQELILEHNPINSTQIWSNGENGTKADYSNESGQHYLKVVNECGSDSSSFFIERKLCTCDLIVPSAFSPNNDGFNNVFAPILDCDQLEYYELNIFNRWGELLYNTDNINDNWDGSFNGKTVQAGLYFYTINYSGIQGRYVENKSMKGVIHLLR